MGNHVIVRYDVASGSGRERLHGVYDDEQFNNLPLVKQFGAFPSGLHAVHFGDEMPEHVAALPESRDDAIKVLKQALAVCQQRKWMVQIDGARVLGTFSSKTQALAAMVDFVRYWRWSGTAIPEDGYWKRTVPGGRPERYLLRQRSARSTRTVATIAVLPSGTRALGGYETETDCFSTSYLRSTVERFRAYRASQNNKKVA